MKLLAPLERDIGLQPCESLVPESAGRSDNAVAEEVVRLGST
jgi:hypothetical protein